MKFLILILCLCPTFALNKYDAVSHYNTAVKHMDNLNRSTAPLVLQQLFNAKLLAFDPELRLKASWNHASVLVELYNSNDPTIKELLQIQKKDVISSWQDVCDLPGLSTQMLNQAKGTLRSLTRETRQKKNPESSQTPPENSMVQGLKTIFDYRKKHMYLKNNETQPLGSPLERQSVTILNIFLSLLRKKQNYVLESLSLEIFEQISSLLNCMVLVSDIDINGIDVDSTSITNIAHCVDKNIEWKTIISSDQHNLLRFVSRIVRTIVRPHRRRKELNTHQSSSNIVVVGAGPTGLSTAIAAFREGAETVTIYEKRGIPTRHHWFDADPSTMHLLKMWGLDLLDIRMQLEKEMPNYATLQCNVLERFLGLIASASGIEIKRHVLVESVNEQENILILKDATTTTHFSSVQFDILFICDGTNSQLRNSLNIASSFQNSFSVVRGKRIKFLHEKDTPLSQTSLILGFQQNKQGDCPKFDVKKTAFDPALINTDDRRVTAIFKRMYPPFCECQILFSNKTFDPPLEMDQAYIDDLNVIPYELVRTSINSLFVNKFDTVERLRNALLPYLYDDDENGNNEKKHAILFRMGIKQIETPAFASSAGALIIFRGDALISAHYRLGIGINQALGSLNTEVTAPLKQLMFHRRISSSDISKELAKEAIYRMTPRISWMAQIQLYTLFYESYCDVIVDNSNLNDLVVLKKDFMTKKLLATPLTKDEILKLECMQKMVDV